MDLFSQGRAQLLIKRHCYLDSPGALEWTRQASVVLPEGRTSAPLKFRLFSVGTFSTWRKWVAPQGTCLCGDFQL